MGKYEGKGSFIWKYKGKGFSNKAMVKEGWSISRGLFIWKYKGKGLRNKVVAKERWSLSRGSFMGNMKVKRGMVLIHEFIYGEI